MYCTKTESIVYDETSTDSNESITNQECSDDLNMLYLLATVAEQVSIHRFHALATAADGKSDAPKCDTHTNDEMTALVEEKCESDKRLFREKCPFCCRCFSRKENLRWHIKKHIRENPEDAASFTFSPSLLPDQLVPEHTEGRLISAVPDSCGFWCVKCGKSFQREATYRIHMRFHARRRSPFSLPLPCRKCAELCTTKTQYLIHKKMHRLEKIFRRRGLMPEAVVV